MKEEIEITEVEQCITT